MRNVKRNVFSALKYRAGQSQKVGQLADVLAVLLFCVTVGCLIFYRARICPQSLKTNFTLSVTFLYYFIFLPETRFPHLFTFPCRVGALYSPTGILFCFFLTFHKYCFCYIHTFIYIIHSPLFCRAFRRDFIIFKPQ